ncbi:MAG: glycosyltransferase, partial [Candidatus Altiarchaeota archaeon]
MDFASLQLVLFTFISFVFCFVSIFWMLVLLEERERIYEDPKPTRKPSLSVIVPAYNEGDGIGECISSLLRLDYQNLSQIIVVNDGSTDNTREV